MLARINSKNQLTLPEEAAGAFGDAEYFEVEVRDGCIILTPTRIQRADAVRMNLGELKIGQEDVVDAVEWARTPVRNEVSDSVGLYKAFVDDAQAAEAEMERSGLHYSKKDGNV